MILFKYYRVILFFKNKPDFSWGSRFSFRKNKQGGNRQNEKHSKHLGQNRRNAFRVSFGNRDETLD